MRSSRGTTARPDPTLRHAGAVDSDAQKEAARAMEMFHAQLVATVIDPYWWKWAMVTLHHALQAFVVASLEPIGVAPPTGEDPPLRAVYGRPARYAEPQVDYLPGLYAEMKSVTGFAPAGNLDRDVARLCTVRDVLIQRLASRWSLDIASLPRMTTSCLAIPEFLGWNPGHIPWQRGSLLDIARVKHLASLKILEALERQRSE